MSLQQLDALQTQPVKQRTALSNQLQAFECSSMMSEEVAALYLSARSTLETQLREAEKCTRQLIVTPQGELLKQFTSIPGLGTKTAVVLIAISGGFKKFDNYKQLCSYIGLSPVSMTPAPSKAKPLSAKWV